MIVQLESFNVVVRNSILARSLRERQLFYSTHASDNCVRARERKKSSNDDVTWEDEKTDDEFRSEKPLRLSTLQELMSVPPCLKKRKCVSPVRALFIPIANIIIRMNRISGSKNGVECIMYTSEMCACSMRRRRERERENTANAERVRV